MNKTLSIEYPILDGHPVFSDLFSFMYCYDCFKNWVCDNLNQIVYIRDYQEREFFSKGFFYEHQPKEQVVMYFDIPLIETNRINIACINIDIIDFIISQINYGYYVRMAINMGKIKKFQESYMHTIFIYGYDNSKEIMYVSNFQNGKKYSNYMYSFREVRAGYNSRVDSEEYTSFIILLKPALKEYFFSVDKIKKEMNSYLISIDFYHKYDYSVRWKNCDIYFGEAYINELIIDIENNKGNIISIYTLYDFTKILDVKRNILFRNNYINEYNSNVLRVKINNCILEANNTIMLYLYLQTKNQGYYKLIPKILDLKKNIHEIIENFISLL